ncbi:MAG: M20 family metallopeptidase [Deferrisomatales bacterium]
MAARVDPVELARDLVRFRTVNPPGEEGPCLAHLAALLEAAGFQVSLPPFAPGRVNLVARLGEPRGRGALCFAGHVDTVPLGAARWALDPFEGRVEGGRLHGRGASDMKSGVAAFVAAAVELAAAGQAPGLVLAVVGGEETGCEGSFHLARTPERLGPVGALVVAEPTANYPLVGHKGALWLRAVTRGVTAHGSMPELGVNAIYKAVRAVIRLEAFAFEAAPHPVLGAPTLNVGTFSGGLNINSVPDRAEVGVDLRTVPGQDHGELVGRLARCLGDEVELSPVLDVPGVWTDPRDPWIQEVYDVLAPVLGTRPEPRGVAYFTDASALVPALGGVPAVILGPGEPEQAHRSDESCPVENIRAATAAYVEIARRWYAR